MGGVAGIVLAAGAGTRLGSPKAIFPLAGEPLALVAARTLAAAGCAPTVIVIGCNHEEIQARLSAWPLVVVNRDWPRGQFSSLQAGLRAVPEEQWAAVLPVDTVGVAPETVRTLIAAALAAPAAVDAVVPAHAGRWGHPVMLAPRLRALLLGLAPETARLDHVLRDAAVVVMATDDQRVLRNLNTPADWDSSQ